MLDSFDEYFATNWFARFFDVRDLRTLTLVSKSVQTVADAAIKRRVRAVCVPHREVEEEWLCRFAASTVRCRVPVAHTGLRSLQLRYFRRREYHALVQRDPRLSRVQKRALHAVVFDAPYELFYWFVLELLPIDPVRLNFPVLLFRKSLALPYGRTYLRRDVYAELDERTHVRIMINGALAGVVTNRSEVWTTSLWTEEVGDRLAWMCTRSSMSILTEGRSHCPFCGLQVSDPSSHTFACMQNYSRWESLVPNDINTSSLFWARHAARYHVQKHATSSATKDGVSARVSRYDAHAVSRRQSNCRGSSVTVQ